MKRKIIGFIIIFAGFLGLCALAYYLFVKGFFPAWMNFGEKSSPVSTVYGEPKDKAPENKIALFEDKEPKKIISFNDNEIEIKERDTEDEKGFTKEDLERIASSFAERFGSYSNQSNFSNVEDLEIYMTSKMKAWSDDFVLKHRGAVSDSESYFGVTTKAIDAEVLEYDDVKGEAKIKVTCRRRESQNTISNSGEVYSQNIIVVMKKEYEAWKVDAAFWEDRK